MACDSIFWNSLVNLVWSGPDSATIRSEKRLKLHHRRCRKQRQGAWYEYWIYRNGCGTWDFCTGFCAWYWSRFSRCGGWMEEVLCEWKACTVHHGGFFGRSTYTDHLWISPDELHQCCCKCRTGYDDAPRRRSLRRIGHWSLC